MLRIRSHILYIPTNRIELPPLLMHNVRHVPKQFIQLANTLLDIPNLRLPLHNQRVLEIDFILRRQTELVLLLDLRLLLLLL